MTVHALKPRATAEQDEPPPDLSYEHEQRRHIASRDWARVHCRGDRGEPMHECSTGGVWWGVAVVVAVLVGVVL